jgi:hypothetical protein
MRHSGVVLIIKKPTAIIHQSYPTASRDAGREPVRICEIAKRFVANEPTLGGGELVPAFARRVEGGSATVRENVDHACDCTIEATVRGTARGR